MNKIVISIGNTDNKLTQMEWSDYVSDVELIIEKMNILKHFFGGSSNWEWWQNAAWILEVHPKDIDVFVKEIKRIREKYKQDSAFVMIGEGLFI